MSAKPSNFARFQKRKAGTKNRTETAYEAHLGLLLRAGEIQGFMYEGIKLRLADKTWYTPDFLVFANDGVVEIHDTKGTTRKLNTKNVKVEKAWCEDDAKVKIKVVAEMFPFRTFMVHKSGNQWVKQQF